MSDVVAKARAYLSGAPAELPSGYYDIQARDIIEKLVSELLYFVGQRDWHNALMAEVADDLLRSAKALKAAADD